MNPLHNVVHLLIGALGVILWRTAPKARLYGWALAVPRVVSPALSVPRS